MKGTSSDTATGVANYFKSSTTGADYLIDYDGTIYQLNEAGQYSHHAGGLEKNSEWTPRTADGKLGKTLYGDDINKATIGIEVLGASGAPYTQAQQQSGSRLVRGLALMYDIDPRNITSHKLVSEEGKPDGNEYLAQLRDSVSSAPQDY
jgi:N-acetyl-anhydromuramyl-L-alanine amidase AmpD